MRISIQMEGKVLKMYQAIIVVGLERWKLINKLESKLKASNDQEVKGTF